MIWIELHCDVRTEGRASRRSIELGCETQRNEGPNGAAASPATVPAVISAIHAEAMRRGWTRRGKKWLCPFCTSKAAPLEIAKT